MLVMQKKLGVWYLKLSHCEQHKNLRKIFPVLEKYSSNEVAHNIGRQVKF